MTSDDYQPGFSDYLAILRRRAALIVGTFLAILAAASAIALLLPPAYQSTGTILIESQQIPTELVQASVTSYADERIEVIKQRVMTRENLLRIVSKHKLFDPMSSRVTPSEQIDQMRRNTRVELITANLRPGMRGSGTIAFKVSFEDRRAETAQAVANELVTLFLDENVKVRTERATQTTVFLKQESDRLRRELDKLEAQIASYKQEHGKALPENISLGIAAIQRTESELRQAERDHQAAEEELRYLEDERRAAMAAAQTRELSPTQSAGAAGELQRVRAELARLQSTYTEDHPDVRAAKRRIDNLERTVAAENPAGTQDAARDPATSRIETRIAGVRARMNALGGQRVSLRTRLGQMESHLLNAPQVERGLATLTRDYQSAQRKYEDIRAKQATAQVAENLEGEQKAERFALLEPPTVPEKPIRPDRKRLLAMGIVVAGAGSAGLAALMEALNGTVRGVEALSAVLGSRPLGTIPYIQIAAEAGLRRRRYALLAGASVGALLLGLVGIHFMYLPLDMLMSKVIVRMG